MPSQAGDTGEQHRAAGDRLQASLRVCQTDRPTPPVVNQCHRPCREVAAIQVLRDVAAPTPLILQFVEAVLAIGAIPVQLANGFKAVVRVGHQDGILPERGRIGAVHEEAQGADPVRVQGRAGSVRLGWGVVSDLGACLMAVEHLDAAVGVENPGRTQGFAAALEQGLVHPGRAPGPLGRAPSALLVAAALGWVRGEMHQGAA
jgi:hypothetical protein